MKISIMSDWNVCYWVDYTKVNWCIKVVDVEWIEEEAIKQWVCFYSILEDKLLYVHQFKKETIAEAERLTYLWQFEYKKSDCTDIREIISPENLDILLEGGYLQEVDWEDLYIID